MRALLLGVVGVVLAGGAAEAGGTSCPETKAVFVAVDHKWAGYEDYRVTNPDLIGQEFHVIRRAAGPVKRSESLTLRSGKQIYQLRSEWAPRTTGTLYTSTKSRAGSLRVVSPQTVEVGQYTTTTIFDGPLKALTLQVKSCTN